MTFQSILLCASRPFGAQGCACAPERNPHVSMWCLNGRLKGESNGLTVGELGGCV